MARKALDIGIRLERQEKKILKLRQELEEAQDLYEKLLEEKAEADKEKLFEAYKKSKRSLDEIVELMQGKADIRRICHGKMKRQKVLAESHWCGRKAEFWV